MTIKKNHTFTFSGWNAPLAYLVGVYLSDGCVHRPKGRMAIFSHSSIDREFTEKTLSALNVILSHNVRWREMHRTKFSGLAKPKHPKTVYEVSVSNEQFGTWLEEVTKEKSVIPKIPKKYLKHTLEAILDGDGYISIFKDSKQLTKRRLLMCYQAGITGKHEFMPDLVKAFNTMGIILQSLSKGKRDVLTYKVPLYSLATSGISFSIHRKFFRFCEYVNQVKSSTTICRTLQYTSEDIV